MIDYNKIAASINHYELYGFKRIESPWTVTKAIADITRPVECNNFTIEEKGKVLVASGEQSFLYLYNKGFLPKGAFMSITPCFRDESFDAFHTKYFIKNELIVTDIVSDIMLSKVIDCAVMFFKNYIKNGITVIQTGTSSYDITYEGIELGSYGIRKCDYLEWIYGTGIAEPRLTRTLKKYGLS